MSALCGAYQGKGRSVCDLLRDDVESDCVGGSLFCITAGRSLLFTGYSVGYPNTRKGITDYEAGILAAFLLEPSSAKRLFREEGVLIDDAFYLYGRPGRGIRVRKTPEQLTEGMDLSRPVIVIDHQPRELQELADAGVDLDLCGHTHDGQTFPGNLTARLFWENICGYLQKGNMHNIVTSGVGVFGPDMRLGTRSEICVITVRFSE